MAVRDSKVFGSLFVKFCNENESLYEGCKLYEVCKLARVTNNLTLS